VTAIDHGALAASTLPTATVGADGSYALTLAAGRTYELLVEPVPGRGLARDVVAVVKPGATAAPAAVTVPPALTWSAVVTGAGRPVAGALVQVYCAAPAATCFEPNLVLAQGVTAADGTATLLVPGPLAGP
jgi:hypothetical protein